MDPALIGFDLAQAGVIVADMIISYLAAGAPPLDCEEPNDDDVQDRRSASVETGVYLHSSIDAGASPVQSGEHGSSVQPGQQGSLAGLAAGADPRPRPRPRPVWNSRQHPHRLQELGRRCGDGPDRGDLLTGSLTAGTLEPGLAPAPRIVRNHRYPRHRRRWRVPSWRLQRWYRSWNEGHLCPGRTPHDPRAPPRRQTQ